MEIHTKTLISFAAFRSLTPRIRSVTSRNSEVFTTKEPYFHWVYIDRSKYLLDISLTASQILSFYVFSPLTSHRLLPPDLCYFILCLASNIVAYNSIYTILSLNTHHSIHLVRVVKVSFFSEHRILSSPTPSYQTETTEKSKLLPLFSTIA